MLFNSYIFIFLFLPVTLFGFFYIGVRGNYYFALAWLVGTSLFFYGWWNPAYIFLIVSSVIFNYFLGSLLNNPLLKTRKIILIFGIFINLFLLGYFKYYNFFILNINNIFSSSLPIETIILPLAISFFTFQQITYLVDAYKGRTSEYDFLHYCLFVTFFPQLIAGPIVHHKEMLPQFTKKIINQLNYENLAVGLTIFVFGLFKKVVIADGIAGYATPVFSAAEAGITLTFFDAWGGALAYTFQLYFDFSGYSDMAIGLARMFGIRLPLNFNSPYKANNIIEFWRRWHMTLSRFLREYLYIPLGGNRKGSIRRHINLMITMLLGGLWHGAGWTFVAWGALHGLYLIINHSWQTIYQSTGWYPKKTQWWSRSLSCLLTFTAVVVAWVFFRAESFDGAIAVLQGMAGINGIQLPENLEVLFFNAPSWIVFSGNDIGTFGSEKGLLWIIFLMIITWTAPNTQQIMFLYKPAYETYQNEIQKWRYSFFQWKPNTLWVGIIVFISLLSIEHMRRISEFLYFQF